jgi:hypothetical protein
VRPRLTPADRDNFVVIETDEYELDRDKMKAVARRPKRVPDRQIWLANVTSVNLHRFGGHGLRGRPRSPGGPFAGRAE